MECREIQMNHGVTMASRPGVTVSGRIQNVRHWLLLTGILLSIVSSVSRPALGQDVLWTYDSGGSIYSSPTIANNGTIYVGSYHALHAINPNGTQKWTFPTDGWVTCSPAIAENGTIIFGGGAENPPNPIPGWGACISGDTNIYALRPDGTQEWVYDTGSSVDYTSPAIASDGTIYVTTSSYGGQPEPSRLLALNPDGSFKWEFVTDHWNFSAPAIGRDGTVYFGTMNTDMGLIALNPDGSLKWTYSVGYWVVSSPAIDTSYVEDVIYVGTFNTSESLIAVNADGTERWSYPTNYMVCHTAPVIDRTGIIYIGSRDRAVHAVNPDGTQAWRNELGYWVEAPPSVGDDGMIYIADMGGTLHALDDEGVEQWDYQPSTYWTRGGASIKDSTLYWTSYDGNLTALTVSSAQVDESSWPKYQADLANMGSCLPKPVLTVSPDPLIAGQDGTFTVSNMRPSTQTFLAYSLRGFGSRYIAPLNVTLDLNQPVQAGEMVMSDEAGTAQWILPIPMRGQYRNVWVQACQHELTTNVVATSIE